MSSKFTPNDSSKEDNAANKSDEKMEVDNEGTNNKTSNGSSNGNSNDTNGDEVMHDAGDGEGDDDDDEDDNEDDFHFKWLDGGHRRNGRKEYDSVFLTLHGTSFKVTKNDFILLWGLHGEEQEKEDDIMNQTIEDIWLSAGCAQVTALWEEKDEKGDPKAMFRARWFFQKSDMERLFVDNDVEDGISLQALKKRMCPREVVGSSETGSYSMATIGGPARVFFRAAPSEEEEKVRLAEEAQKRKLNGGRDDEKDDSPQLPKDAFTCRYTIRKTEADELDDNKDEGNKNDSQTKKRPKMEIIPYEHDKGSDDDDNDDDDDERQSKKRRRGSNKDNDSVEDEEESSDGTSSDDESRRNEPEGEGGVLNQGKIRVGPQHQVPVPVFDPKNTKVVSRKPTLVWSPNKAPTQEQMDDYFQKASAILTPFAEQQLLVMGVKPSTLIPSERMEKLMQERESNTPLRVSSISTASSLASSSPKNYLIRECDADALLKNLHDEKYSVEAAVAMVKASPRDFLANWSTTERECFDESFRRNAGSLLMVAKSVSSLTSSKTHCHVVDYHYRFKIPDQFRRYQDKKREQAVRMMECIEARKFTENTEVKVLPQTIEKNGDGNSAARGENKRPKNWSETATSDVTKAVEERRSSAKQLLLDIQRDMGKEKMAEVAGAIISLNQGSERESKEALLRILKNEPQLHQRLVEFLPKKFFK